MAILEHETVTSESGFNKELEESALTMIFDNLQKSQYHYPVKSTVREIACNALDSIKERDAAKKILKGDAKEEDYFIRRDEALYRDSNFNIDYYDPNWLSNEPNVIITYYSFEDLDKQDYLSIKDYGVGLGGKRLEGYMRLGYSTKRNSKLSIGKYGIGAKAPLSTNVPSYRMITTYNGKRFIFDIFSHKVDSAVPKLNMTTGKLNNGYTFANGYTAYYEETTDKNSTEIIVQTKKHHRQAYVDAVKSQLLYLQGIKFYINRDGYLEEKSIYPEILYEDDKIILADNHQFSKPHIVIDGVAYGYVDFLELELEEKAGNVGIKVAPEEITVNPSRESVVWNEQTRETVVNRFKEVVGIATAYVEKSLSQTDFIAWLKAASSVLTSVDRSSTLGRLSQLIDKSSIEPAFSGEPTIKFAPAAKFFRGFKARVIIRKYDSKKGKYRTQRIEVDSWSDLDFDHIYLQMEHTQHGKDMYLYYSTNPDDYARNYNSYSSKPILVLEPMDIPADLKPAEIKGYKEYQLTLLKLLSESKSVKKYEEVVIPDDWADKLTKAETEEEEEKADILTPAERRKLNSLTVFKYPQRGDKWYMGDIKFSIDEWSIGGILALEHDPTLDVLVYGFQEDRDLLEALFDYIDGIKAPTKIKIIQISQQNEKHYIGLEKAIHVKDIFKSVDNKTIKVHNILIKYNTARIVSPCLKKLDFLTNFATIDSEVFDKFKEVDDYVNNNGYTLSNMSLRNDIDDFLNKVTEFQLFVKEVEGEEKLIAKKSKELFGEGGFENAVVLDTSIYDAVKELESYAEPIGTLLNEVEPLTHKDRIISAELETEIKSYINFKLGK